MPNYNGPASIRGPDGKMYSAARYKQKFGREPIVSSKRNKPKPNPVAAKRNTNPTKVIKGPNGKTYSAKRYQQKFG